MSKWRRRIDEKASRMILSDSQFHILQDRWSLNKAEERMVFACPICRDFCSSVVPFFSCSNHLVCAACFEHARASDVKVCPLCPVPDAHLHLQCPECSHLFFCPSEANTGADCPACKSHFQPRLIRTFKRSAHTYTNFLTENEKQILKSEFEDGAGRVRCPGCRHPIERAVACNELFHCGHERVCAACGCFSFRWEAGLVQHRRESGCMCMPDAQEDEVSCVRKRFRESLERDGVHT
jgi:hypothetical protein